MALGKRRRTRQEELWVSAACLPKSIGHIFYQKLNQVLAEAQFDDFLEQECR